MNLGWTYRTVVADREPGTTLASYLTDRYGHSTLQEWEARIRHGRVLLNGSKTAPETVVAPGNELTWRRPPWSEPPAPLVFEVLHRDAHLLAVDKPAGLPTLPGAGFLEHTLLHQVRRHEPDAAPVHRLGRWTSGIVLFARSREARAPLAAAWRSGEVRKRYRALASGRARRSQFEVRAAIGPVPHRLLGAVHAATATGKPAITRVTVLKQGRDTFLADAEILTGRPHQIRIHLAAAGHPLVGDPLYARGGVPSRGCRALPGDSGYLLHATELELSHPFEARALDIRSAAPPRLRCP